MKVSKPGLPAASEALNNTRPVLGRTATFLRQFTPIIDYLGLYKREIAAFFADDAAVTEARQSGIHYLRTQNPTNPEIMAAYPNRISTNRSNPYREPGGYSKLASERHLEVFGNYLLHPEPRARAPGPRPAASGERDLAPELLHLRRHGEPRCGPAVRPPGPARPAHERRPGRLPAPPATAIAATRRRRGAEPDR